MQAETLKQQISAAKGEVEAELVLKRAKVVNVFTNEIEEADVAIHHGKIIGVGEYSGQDEVDLDGKYVCPGLIDGHIHIESSMLCGPAFEQLSFLMAQRRSLQTRMRSPTWQARLDSTSCWKRHGI